MTAKGYVDRDDVVMVPRSYLRPEFISYASAVQEAPNPYDVNTTAKKTRKNQQTTFWQQVQERL